MRPKYVKRLCRYLFVAAAAITGGCAGSMPGPSFTPVVATPTIKAIGLFEFQQANPATGIRAHQLRGVGLTLSDGGIQLGYVRHEQIIADLTKNPSSDVRTASLRLATGEVAERRGRQIIGLHPTPASEEHP